MLLLVGEPSARRPVLYCSQLPPSTASSTLTHRRPVPDADSLSLVPVLVGPWSASGSVPCCSHRPHLRHRHLDDLFPTTFHGPSCRKNHLYLVDDARQMVSGYMKHLSYFQNPHRNLTLDDLDLGNFKVTKVKIVCGVSPVRDDNLAIGHLISFDDLDLQEY